MVKQKNRIPTTLKDLIGSAMTPISLTRAKPIENKDLQILKNMLDNWPFERGLEEIEQTRELLDFMFHGNPDMDTDVRKLLRRFQEILMMAYPFEDSTILH